MVRSYCQQINYVASVLLMTNLGTKTTSSDPKTDFRLSSLHRRRNWTGLQNFWWGFTTVLWIRIRTESRFNAVPGSGSGSGKAKIIQKNRKQFIHFIVWSAGCSLLRPESFSCSLDVLYGGIGIGTVNFNFWSKK